jgi:hypothetical protein
MQNSTFFGEGEELQVERSSSNVKDLLRVGLSASVSTRAVAMSAQTKDRERSATETKEGKHQVVSKYEAIGQQDETQQSADERMEVFCEKQLTKEPRQLHHKVR